MTTGVTTRCAWPGRGESVTELMLFMYFLVHPYTCYSDRHASPYWTFIHRWISRGFTPFTTLFFVACCKRGRHVYTINCAIVLHRTATWQPLFKPWVPLLSTYKTIELCFEFLSHF
jgi:hypothetical protein